MGVCASSGGFYRAYHVTQGIDEIIPVDVYVPGCPPTPEELMYGIFALQKKIRSGEKSRDSRSARAAGATAGVTAAPPGQPAAVNRAAAVKSHVAAAATAHSERSTHSAHGRTTAVAESPGSSAILPDAAAEYSAVGKRREKDRGSRADAARNSRDASLEAFVQLLP